MLRQNSFDSVKTIFIDRNELLDRLRAIAERIHAENPEVETVRVFGSVARGDQTGTSDVDVLIELRETGPIDALSLIRRFQPYFDLPIGCDLLVFTEEEVARRLQAGDGFMRQVWSESIPLEPSTLE